jgi:hypothetical protein
VEVTWKENKRLVSAATQFLCEECPGSDNSIIIYKEKRAGAGEPAPPAFASAVTHYNQSKEEQR